MDDKAQAKSRFAPASGTMHTFFGDLSRFPVLNEAPFVHLAWKNTSQRNAWKSRVAC